MLTTNGPDVRVCRQERGQEGRVVACTEQYGRFGDPLHPFSEGEQGGDFCRQLEFSLQVDMEVFNFYPLIRFESLLPVGSGYRKEGDAAPGGGKMVGQEGGYPLTAAAEVEGGEEEEEVLHCGVDYWTMGLLDYGTGRQFN